uniref:Uncharacterized protein n=1 Tax=Parascaris equorum TaxID=6256 RepID=A0A914RPQ1_PAREQ
MLGYTVGNAQQNLIAVLCQDNTFMSLLDNTFTKQLISVNQPTAKENMDETTSINQMHLSTAKNRTATMEKTTAEEAVTALWSRADGSHIEQGHGLFATSGSDTTTSVDNHNQVKSTVINRRISTDHKGNQTEAENAHCDYIPAPVEAAPIPVIFAPNDDGEKKSETKAAAIIRQATGF